VRGRAEFELCCGYVRELRFVTSFHITRLTRFPLRTALAMQLLCGLLDSSGWLVEATNTTPTRSVPFFQVLLTEFNDLAKRGNAIRRPALV